MKRIALALLCLSVMAFTTTQEITSGTGFYVSTGGHVITNEHVVQGCREIYLRSAGGEVPAQLVAVDEVNDLALIQSSARSKKVAALRHEQNLKPGDEVTIMGYPVENGSVEHYRVRTAKIIDTVGPTGQTNWLQFTDSLKKGNSGGPLLDAFGNVIGVVRAKVTYFDITYEERNGVRKETERKAGNVDVAVNLPILTQFLEKHFVPYNAMLNYQPLSRQAMEETGRGFIVNVQCVQ